MNDNEKERERENEKREIRCITPWFRSTTWLGHRPVVRHPRGFSTGWSFWGATNERRLRRARSHKPPQETNYQRITHDDRLHSLCLGRCSNTLWHYCSDGFESRGQLRRQGHALWEKPNKFARSRPEFSLQDQAFFFS